MPGEPAKEARCRVCTEKKPGNQFYSNKGRRSGLQDVCIKCTSIAKSEASWRKEIREKGAKAFGERINEIEDRATRMRRVLLGYKPATN